MSTALTVSSDDFFYNLGAQVLRRTAATYGQTPIQDPAAQYGLGELTGIDLPGETQGRVDSQAERLKLHAESPTGFPNTTWYTGDNVEMAFGQGATVITPIEQAVAYSTFANGGTRYAPQVAAAVVSPTGKVVKQFTPQVTGHVTCSPATYQAMLTGFEGVVQHHRAARPTASPAWPASRGAWPARPGRPTPSRARSPPPGSWAGARRPRPPSTWWSASSTRPATAPPPRPRWWARSSTTWPPTRSARPPSPQPRRSTRPPGRFELPVPTTTTTTPPPAGDRRPPPPPPDGGPDRDGVTAAGAPGPTPGRRALG